MSHAPILVVEDDPHLRTFYETALTTAGFHVIAVEDGQDALGVIERTRPSAIVLDLNLPRLGGRDVAREIAALPRPRIPIVIVTGDPDTIDTDHFAWVLRKPVTADEVIAAVQSCIRHARDDEPHDGH